MSPGLTFKTVTIITVSSQMPGAVRSHIIGHIKKIDDGYAYFPKGATFHGEVFSTVEAVKATL